MFLLDFFFFFFWVQPARLCDLFYFWKKLNLNKDPNHWSWNIEGVILVFFRISGDMFPDYWVRWFLCSGGSLYLLPLVWKCSFYPNCYRWTITNVRSKNLEYSQATNALQAVMSQSTDLKIDTILQLGS